MILGKSIFSLPPPPPFGGTSPAKRGRIILRANANRNNDLQSAVFDGGRRTAPLSAPLYALCQSHIVALAAAAQPAKHNYVVLCNRGQYIISSVCRSQQEFLQTSAILIVDLSVPIKISIGAVYGGMPASCSQRFICKRTLPALCDITQKRS